MQEPLQPIVGNKKIKKNKYITTFTCPVCGEYINKPAQGFLLYEKETVKKCPFCEMPVDWSVQKQELIELQERKREKYLKEQNEKDKTNNDSNNNNLNM